MSEVIVIGAGVVGLAVAHHLVLAGRRVTVVDADPAGDKASYGNAGGIAVSEVLPASAPGVLAKVPGWLLDPLGPLAVRPRHVLKLLPWLWRFQRESARPAVARNAAALAALNLRAYADLAAMLGTHGLAATLQRNGALALYQRREAFAADAPAWAMRQALGVELQMLSGHQARDLEPALAESVHHAVFIPQWAQVHDPKVLVDLLRQRLIEQGVHLVQGRVAALRPAGAFTELHLHGGGRLQAAHAVVAAGAWSGLLAKSLGDRVLLESERGYNLTLPAPGVALSRELIFAERHFVATPLACGLRIGGAAEFGGLHAAPDYRRSARLAGLAATYLPGLCLGGGTPWAGHRPATPDSLPVIGRSPRAPGVVYAFGHGHLGLTQAATTGRLVASLVLGQTPALDLSPFAIERFNPRH